MLGAAIADLLACPGVAVTTTRGPWCQDSAVVSDATFPPGVFVMDAPTPARERRLFRQLSREADLTLVIAPEMGEVLERRCRWLEDHGLRSLNSSGDAIQLFGDKLATARWLDERGAPTIPTRAVAPGALAARAATGEIPTSGQWVLKPRYGAGSWLTFGIHAMERRAVQDESATGDDLPGSAGRGSSGRTWHQAATDWRATRERPEMIRQPWIAGTPLSVAVLSPLRTGSDQPGSQRLRVFPVARQLISDDGRFSYQGSLVPAGVAPSVQAAAQQIAEQIAGARPGLAGYWGLDLLHVSPEQFPETAATAGLMVVEINPRLTTSYLAYRQLAANNLAARWLGLEQSDNEPIRWRTAPVQWLVEQDATTRPQAPQ